MLNQGYQAESCLGYVRPARSCASSRIIHLTSHHASIDAVPYIMQLYGLYKRSTVGACNVRQPTLLVEPIARERYNAWKMASTMSEEQAMREYLDLARYVPT